jgi:hypothetical protein
MEDNLASTVWSDKFDLPFDLHERIPILKRVADNNTALRIKLEHESVSPKCQSTNKIRLSVKRSKAMVGWVALKFGKVTDTSLQKS